MKKRVMVDERIINEQNRVFRNAYYVVQYGLLVAMLYRWLVLHQGISQMFDLLVPLTVGQVYAGFSFHWRGHPPFVMSRRALRWVAVLIGISSILLSVIILLLLALEEPLDGWLMVPLAIGLLLGGIGATMLLVKLADRLARHWEQEKLLPEEEAPDEDQRNR